MITKINLPLKIKAFFDIQEIRPLIKEPETPIPYASTKGLTQGMEIELQGVSFKYPDTTSSVVQNINLKIKPGQVRCCNQIQDESAHEFYF